METFLVVGSKVFCNFYDIFGWFLTVFSQVEASVAAVEANFKDEQGGQ